MRRTSRGPAAFFIFGFNFRGEAVKSPERAEVIVTPYNQGLASGLRQADDG
jgi:hypothetical protein